MSAEDAFVLLISCYMHDAGMGVSEKDFYEFMEVIPHEETIPLNDKGAMIEFIRKYHYELSSAFVSKYGSFFELPDEDYINAVACVSCGHRKTDLYSESDYSSDRFCLPYMAALIRLADEIDIAETL